MSRKTINLTEESVSQQPEIRHPPLQLDQEWANALTHAIGVALTLFAGFYLVTQAGNRTTGLMIGCLVYIVATLGTYLFSTLSHVVRSQPTLNTLRAWDQAMIYAMIAGTYTPLVVKFCPDPTRIWLLAAIWAAAFAGFYSKVGMRHRVNASGTVSYLLLGYLPSVVLASQVPAAIAGWMLAGGIIYSVGVVFLINDTKLRYLHAGWHLMVLLASTCHFVGMVEVVSV